MKLKRLKRQSGFTLLELVIVMGLVTLFIGITMPLYSKMSDTMSSVDTETNIQVLGGAIEEWYSENAWEIDSNSDASIVLPTTNGTAYTMSNDTNSLENEGWKTLALRYTSSQNVLTDGYNHAYKVFVSQRQEQSYEGNLIPYHIIAIVSGRGNSPVIEDGMDGDTAVSSIQSTFDVATGDINAHPEDEIYVVSGFDIQKQKYKNSKKKLNTVANAYEDYYWSRYVGQGSEPAINYFGRNGSNIRWDTSANIDVITNNNNTDVIGSSGRRELGNEIYNSGLPAELQLSSKAVTSDWDRPFRLLNDGTTGNIQTNGAVESISARTPDNGGYPPYTAVLGFSMPNGESYTQTVTSRF